ncbi:MAG: tetratricopeptide repeat protein [Nevskia sp.]|nr:tetratricopeptide repeat protein [Nevskia sp.]
MLRGLGGLCLAAGLWPGLASADGAQDLKSAISEQNRGNDALGILLYSSAIKDPNLPKPDLAIAYFNRAEAYLAEGEYDSAIADYDALLQLSPNDPEYYYSRGEAYRGKGDKDQAIADYTQAIKLDPRNAWAYCNRGNVYRTKGDYARAMADYNHAVELSPRDAGLYYNRGTAYKNMADDDHAIADYDIAIKLDPKHVLAYYNRGTSYRSKGDLDRAIADYSSALRLDPKISKGYYNRANAYWAKGKLDEALADYDQTVQLTPKDAWPYFNRAGVYMAKGNYERAMADYGHSLQLNPRNADAHVGLGTARFFLGDYGEAAQDFSDALNSQSDSLLASLGEAGSSAETDKQYRLIWRYVARARSGADGRTELQSGAESLHPEYWPYPIIAFFLGKTTQDQLMAAAKDPDPQQQRGHLCEAAAWLGESRLIANDAAGAAAQLQTARDQCPANFTEHQLAVAELRRMGAPGQ